MDAVSKRGYLHEKYRLFHSSDRRDVDFETHSHDFHKIVLCLNGRVTYIVEGVTYFLRPGDVLIIPEHQIHRSILHFRRSLRAHGALDQPCLCGQLWRKSAQRCV